jgi:hypothetical protein
VSELGRKGKEYRINGIIHFPNAMQLVPSLFSNSIKLGNKIPMAGGYTVHLNATDA